MSFDESRSDSHPAPGETPFVRQMVSNWGFSVENDRSRLRRSQLADCPLIVIDGELGAGKSFLACRLGCDLRFRVISLDDHLLVATDPTTPYLEQLDYVGLQTDMLSIRKQLIIVGVLALKVLAIINNTDHHYHIYIKLYNGFFGWELGRSLVPKARPLHNKFRQEIVQYAKECNPFDVCDLLLSRDLQSPGVEPSGHHARG